MRAAVLVSCLAAMAGCLDGEGRAVERQAAREQAIGVVPRGSTCAQLGLGEQAFTLIEPVSGDYAIDAQNSLKFRYYDSSRTDFYFTQSTIRMTGVLASNGARTMMWEIPGGSDGWPSLSGPPDEGTGELHTPEEVTFCFDNELYVQPSPLTNRTRRAVWGLSRASPTAPILLAEGQSRAVEHQVTAQPTSFAPLGQSISGPVFVQNKSPNTVTVGAVTTTVAGVAAAVTCPTSPPFSMAPHTTVECSFFLAVSDTEDRLVVGGGTVSHGLKVSTREVTASFSAHNSGTETIDRCVTVRDEASTAADHLLGTACAESGATTFTFSAPVGPFACGAFSLTHTASFAAFDTNASGAASSTVHGEVSCDPGCTRRWDYWRDHSDAGPAPADPTWHLVGPSGEDTAFFRSGVSYIQEMYVVVLPLLNPYWTLGREYIAARLNQLTGVAMPGATAAAFAEATGVFQGSTPLQIQLNLFAHPRLNQLTSMLAAFNNGSVGPGACTP